MLNFRYKWAFVVPMNASDLDPKSLKPELQAQHQGPEPYQPSP